MTLFETSPQFTMFVLFFMLGFVTRFFAQITILVCGKTCQAVGKRVVFVCKKIFSATKTALIKQIARKVKRENKTEIEDKEKARSPKKENIYAIKQKVKDGNVRQKMRDLHFAWGEIVYFVGLGVLTLIVFSKFEFVDYFWFIPLAVIFGVLINDYLTKEVFAKRKKV